MTSPTSTASEPDALVGAGLRRVVAVLSVTQITSWGVLYYAFAALSSSITADTGWSSVAVTGAFSLSQFVAAGIGIWVGRHIDAYGPRRVMTAGSLLAIPAVLAIARAPNLGLFYAGWVLAGRRDGRGAATRRRSPLSPTGPVSGGWSTDHADPGRRTGQHRLRAVVVQASTTGSAGGAPTSPCSSSWSSSRSPCTGGACDKPWRSSAGQEARVDAFGHRGSRGARGGPKQTVRPARRGDGADVAVDLRGRHQPGPDARGAGHEPEPGRGRRSGSAAWDR